MAFKLHPQAFRFYRPMVRSVQKNCGLLCCGPKRTNKKNYKCEMLVNWETNLNYLHFRKENLFLTDEHWCYALSAGDPPKSPVALVYLHCTSYCVLHAYQHSPPTRPTPHFLITKLLYYFILLLVGNSTTLATISSRCTRQSIIEIREKKSY